MLTLKQLVIVTVGGVEAVPPLVQKHTGTTAAFGAGQTVLPGAGHVQLDRTALVEQVSASAPVRRGSHASVSDCVLQGGAWLAVSTGCASNLNGSTGCYTFTLQPADSALSHRKHLEAWSPAARPAPTAPVLLRGGAPPHPTCCRRVAVGGGGAKAATVCCLISGGRSA
jgi:hypothetical protein